MSYPWYAIHIRSRQEKIAELMLRNKGYETFLPLYRVERRWATSRRSVDLPLFSCYLFSQFDVKHRLPILTTPGVLSIIGSPEGPSPVHEAEIAAVRAVIASGYPAEPSRYLAAGDRVVVTSGPLSGVEGILIAHKNSQRLIVSITLLQRSVSVELDRVQVRAVRPASVLSLNGGCGLARTVAIP